VLGLLPEASFVQATNWLVSVDPGLKYHSRDKPFLVGILLGYLCTSLPHYLNGLHNWNITAVLYIIYNPLSQSISIIPCTRIFTDRATYSVVKRDK